MKRPKTDPTRAVAFLRTSTDKQDLSPEAQRAALNGWAAREGVTIVAWYEDKDVSGGADVADSPQLLAALDGLKEHRAGVFAVAKRDRLARDMTRVALVHSLVESAGARIVSAAGEGNGKDASDVLLRGIVDLFAQHEKLVIRARTKAALQVKKGRGERTGAVPYGYRAEATGPVQVRSGVERRTAMLVPDVGEQAVIAIARELRAGGMSYRGIAAELGSRGITSRKGGTWLPTQIVRMLTPPAGTGPRI